MVRFGHAVPVQEVCAAAPDLSIFHGAQARERFDAQFAYAVAEAEEDPRLMVTLDHLVEQLFGEAGFAAGGRADEQVEAGQDAVEGAAEIGKAGLPTADLFYLALSLKGVECLCELFAFGA